MRLLLESAPEVVGHEALLDRVGGRQAVSPGVLSQSIRELRKALDDSPQSPRYVETRHRVGYRFIADVDVVGAPETPHRDATRATVTAGSPEPRPAAALADALARSGHAEQARELADSKMEKVEAELDLARLAAMRGQWPIATQQARQIRRAVLKEEPQALLHLSERLHQSGHLVLALQARLLAGLQGADAARAQLLGLGVAPQALLPMPF